ncbi:MAG: hypothetical protein QM655_13825 [Nocardioidaceae bacterium]
MRDKLSVGLLMAVLIFYCIIVTTKAVTLFQQGGLVPVLFGIALLITALFAIGLSLREIRFGRQLAALGRELAAEGGLPPVDELPRKPSGRVDRAAADEVFERYRAETEAHPDDWRSWFRLALAYDDAGDRKRARAAARHAIALRW